MNAISFYKQYVGRLGSVLCLFDQILEQPAPGPSSSEQAHLDILLAEAMTTFETVAYRMQAQAHHSGLTIDVELGAKLEECRAKLAMLAARCDARQLEAALTVDRP